MKLNELLKGLTVLAATADMDTDITDVCYDSRQTAEGGLIVVEDLHGLAERLLPETCMRRFPAPAGAGIVRDRAAAGRLPV